MRGCPDASRIQTLRAQCEHRWAMNDSRLHALPTVPVETVASVAPLPTSQRDGASGCAALRLPGGAQGRGRRSEAAGHCRERASRPGRAGEARTQAKTNWRAAKNNLGESLECCVTRRSKVTAARVDADVQMSDAPRTPTAFFSAGEHASRVGMSLAKLPMLSCLAAPSGLPDAGAHAALPAAAATAKHLRGANMVIEREQEQDAQTSRAANESGARVSRGPGEKKGKRESWSPPQRLDVQRGKLN
jgi:hypothetical protein